MKIRIDVLGGNFTPEASLKGKVFESKQLTSRTTTTLIGDQEAILSGLSLLNDGTVVWKSIGSSSRHANTSNPRLANMIIHSWDVGNSSRASKINEA